MNNRLLDLYHHSPYPLRVLAASARGYYLRAWRYGPESEQLIAEALERETWSDIRWKQWQEERLAYVLHRAATRVPFYHEYWTQQRRHGNRCAWDIVANWPILTKQQVRDHPEAFVANDCDVRSMFRDSTGGTTGTPITIYVSRKTARQWYALVEARMRRWHHVSIQECWAILGGQLVVPFRQKNPPFWVFNKGLNQLYLSTHHLSTRNAAHYVKALQEYAPTHMVVYPSSAYILATAILEQSQVVAPMRVIFSNAETLLPHHKEAISQAHHCPVRNTYGMGEMVAGASECEAGVMHIWPEAGFIEILDDQHSPTPEVNRLIATSLLNADMPLIRYEVGDRGQAAYSEEPCACGRTLPKLSSIEGRLNDLIITPTGRKIFWLNPAFYGLPIREAQIIQESLGCIHVRFVASPGYTQQDGITIVQRLHERVGDMEITLERVDTIPRAANGKFRAVISTITASES